MTMEKIPLFPLGLVLLPGMPLQLHIFEERYKLMMSECLSGDKAFGIVQFDGKAIHSVGAWPASQSCCTATRTAAWTL